MSSRLRVTVARTSPLALALALAAAAAPASAQTAGEVVDEALQRYEQRMEGVQDYTVIQEIMGFRDSTTFERRTVDGRAVFVPKQADGAGDAGGAEAVERTTESYQAMLVELGQRAEHAGTETVDGMECHVLELTDFSGDAFSSFAPPESADDWTPERLRMYLDRDELLPRKMIMEGTATLEGEKRPVEMTALFQDYRNVDGVVHPFRMQMRVDGLSATMSPEERAQLEASLKEMRKKMEGMSEQQRQMMERMMGDKLEKMEEMLSSGAVEFTALVQEIRVNEGGSP